MKGCIMKMIICFFLVSFFFISCKNENELVDPPIDTSQIIPLKVGNFWTYQYTHYDTLGNIISVSSVTTRVISDTVINGKQAFLFNSGDVFWNDDSGFWIKSYQKSPILEYKYPANIGDYYNNYITVICSDSLITSPRGNFKCYGYSYDRGVNYVCPGIGVIKEENFQSKNIGVSDIDLYLFQKSELIEYNLK